METGTDACCKAPAMEFSVDPKYEFSAPHFFDFCNGETEEEAAAAERWFQAALSHPPSPFLGKVKSVRELSTGCSLEEYIEVQKLVARVSSELPKEMQVDAASANLTSAATMVAEEASVPYKEISLPPRDICVPLSKQGLPCESTKDEPCTPRDQFPQHFAELESTKAIHTAHNIPVKWNHSELHKQATLKNIKTLLPSCKRPTAKRCLAASQKMESGEEKQATKKQKLEGGRSCQVWNTKTPRVAPTLTVSQGFRFNAEKRATKKQKLEGGQSCQVLNTKTPRAAPTLTVPQEFRFNTEKRAHIHKETGQCSSDAQIQGPNLPYIPLAEMVQRFQMNILGELRTQDKITSSRRSLKLTRPKEPMLGTSLRARPPTVKGFAEQEEELLANLPRFKARPLNKRILEGPTLPMLPRSTPQLPEFQEFNLRTMERALMYQQTLPSMAVSSATENRSRFFSSKGEFHLETAARARLPKIKSTEELEQELAMMAKFKARPLNKRIFSSRGDVGVFTVPKRQATRPKEFHFATDQRAQYHDALMMEQQNREQRLIKQCKIERGLSAQEASGENVRISMAYNLPTTGFNDLDISSENDRLQQRRELDAMACQGVPTLSSNVAVYPERSRKPLAEIQQFVFGVEAQAVQATKTDKKYFENNNFYEQEDRSFHVKSTFYPPPVQEYEAFPFHMRSTKDLIQHVTPHVARPKEDRQSQKMSFPVYYMR